jgi:phage/plasmid-like protein (TIGR03299 family)
MSHELTQRADGQFEFAFNGREGAAWHGLGHEVPADHVHDVDYWKTNAGMDWQVKRSRVRFGEGDSQRVWDDHHVLFRSDTKSPIGLVSQGYKIVQPGEVVEFFRDLVGAAGMELSAMGTLQGGRRFWATAKMGEAAPTSPGDRIGGYLLLSTSADGSLATEARLTSIRVVCANTLRMARDGKAAMRITHRTKFDADRVKQDMGLSRDKWREFQHDVIRLANKEVRQAQAEYLVAKILSDGDEKPEVHAKARESRGFKIIMNLFGTDKRMGAAQGATLEGVQGTAWGLLNAVTEFADHHAASRTAENRFISAQWGPNADLKTDAFETLLAL